MTAIPSENNCPSPDERLPRPSVFHIAYGLAAIVVCVSVCLFVTSPAVTIIVTTIAAVAVGLSNRNAEQERWDRCTRILRDVSEQRQKARSDGDKILHEAQQRTLVLSQMRDGVVVLSPSSSIELINESAVELLGLASREGLLGRSFHEIVRIPEVVKAVADARGGEVRPNVIGKDVTIEVGHGASMRPIRVRVDRMTGDSGHSVLVTLRDETESRRVEAMRREFIANISHELKTPVAAIKGYAETVELAIGDDPDAAIHFTKQINGQCERLERLIADVMQLARAQAGPNKLTLTTVNLQEVIAESLGSAMPLAEAKSITISVSNEDQPALVTADHEAILTIANNLISNAIHYTPDGGHVEIDCQRDSDSWTMLVKDDGIGIPESEQDRVFERFYRVNKTRESGGGTGIGLSIVKNLTIALGGAVRVHSQPNKGATFEVQLPAANG